MSWKTAQTVADKVYRELRGEFQPGMVRMIIRALTRELNRDEKARAAAGELKESPAKPSGKSNFDSR